MVAGMKIFIVLYENLENVIITLLHIFIINKK